MKAYRGNGVRIVYSVVREGVSMDPHKITSGEDVARLVKDLQYTGLIPTDQEAFMVLALNSRHKTLAFQTVTLGTLESSLVHPREVFRFAVVTGAAAILLAHNHPSGDATPSGEDRQVTERLGECGQTLGIEVLDHVVVGKDRWYSFADARYHPFPTVPKD